MRTRIRPVGSVFSVIFGFLTREEWIPPYALFRKKCKLVNEGCRFFDTFVGGNVEASFLLGVANFVKSIASIWIYW
ncbi:MAG: hypothetical protein BA865_15210 [Desulfobacterales bacterium S5133MH4]|nr:MAG: hypothetical protein BA865_15210 [Desulfobacterales bacterium S5133MH4]